MARVSAAIAQTLLFQTIQGLDNLETLFYPRSSGGEDQTREEAKRFSWPRKLKELHIAGGIDDYFLENHLVRVPESLEQLDITNCRLRSVFLYIGIKNASCNYQRSWFEVLMGKLR